MGRGSNQLSAARSTTGAQQLLFGKTRQGTREIRFTAQERSVLDDRAAISAYEAHGGQVSINNDGDRFWYFNRQFHRTDGPAVETARGNREWWHEGQLHRTDGPARIDADGNKYWYCQSELHRTDGPAVEWVSGAKAWYLKGQEYHSEEAWRQAQNKRSSAE